MTTIIVCRVPRNSVLPLAVTSRSLAVVDGQSKFKLRITEGNYENPFAVKILGQVEGASATTSSERRALWHKSPMPLTQNKLLPWQYRILEVILLWHAFQSMHKSTKPKKWLRKIVRTPKLFCQIHPMIDYYKTIDTETGQEVTHLREGSNRISPEMSASRLFLWLLSFTWGAGGVLDKWYLW